MFELILLGLLASGLREGILPLLVFLLLVFTLADLEVPVALVPVFAVNSVRALLVIEIGDLR